MNMVSQLWSTVSNYYRTLNPATLSGAIDVIVVLQPDGTLKSSPFHARFGKTGILRPQENVVDLYVNDELIPDIQMMLGEAGEAFFLEDPDDLPPAEPLATAQLEQQPLERRISMSKPDRLTEDSAASMLRAENGDTTGTDEAEDEESRVGGVPPNGSSATLVSYYSDCDGEERSGGFGGTVGAGSRRATLTGYKSDSEQDGHNTGGSPAAVIGGAAEQLMAQLDWEWGKLPHSATMDSVKSGDYFDCTDDVAAATEGTSTIKLSGELVSSEKLNKILEERITASRAQNADEGHQQILSQQEQQQQSQMQPQQNSQKQRQSSERDRLSSSGECYLSDLDDSNRHIYLSGSPSSPESGYKSDQDVASVEEDLNIGVQLSLCGGLDLPNSITTERFLKHLISYEEFLQNPDIIDNRDLVVRIQGKNYNWRTAAPIMLCRAVFRVPLPYRTVQNLKERHMRFRRKRNTMRSWFGWGRARPADDAEANDEEGAVDSGTVTSTTKVEDIKEEANVEERKADGEQPKQRLRTVRLSSNQLKKLGLRPGYNELRYSVTTKYQGTTECTCGVYLWGHDDRVVISDIDGTITRSDVLGHILPMVGKDWTQPRIAKLFSAIEKNDYRFLYLSARAIGQSAVTRRFLQRVRQEGVTLPDGPVLLSPLSLMRAFHQEVIARRPEAFKIACLRDVRALFPSDAQPFWAGFGNRPSDALSYTEVSVNHARCFTVNPQGEVTRESGDCLPSSYQALSEVADLVFPPFQHRFADHENFSHFSYWREPLPELPDFLGIDKDVEMAAAAVTSVAAAAATAVATTTATSVNDVSIVNLAGSAALV